MTETHSIVPGRVPSQRLAGDVTQPFDTGKLMESFFAGMNPRTLAAYRQDLGDFSRHIRAIDPIEAARDILSGSHGTANAIALAYRAHLIERGLAPATINHRLSALRSLVRLANTLGLVSWSLSVKGIKSQPFRDTRGPQIEGFRQLLRAATAQRSLKAARDIAILRLLHDLALRRGEVVLLNVEDLDLDGSRLSILGKGRTEPEPLTLPPQTKQALVAWLDHRGCHDGPLFTNLDRAKKGSGRLSGSAVYSLVRRLGQNAGIKTRPHALRHSAITTALDQTNGDVRAVQRFSRHKDIRVLTVYDDGRQDLGGKVASMLARMSEPEVMA